MNHASQSYRTKRNLSKLLILIASILSIGLLSHQTALAGGTLDTSFGDGGVAHINFGFNSTSQARRVLVQPDGKLVLAGTVDGDCALVRLNSDGSLDLTFGVGGKAQTDFFPSQIDVQDAALQADGKIVVVGAFTRVNNFPTNQIEILRYTSTGALDTSFDGDGIFSMSFGPYCKTYSVAVQPDGKILAGGGNPDFFGGTFGVVVRVNSDGTLDMTFDTDGVVGEATQPKRQIRLQSTGKILVGTGDLEGVLYVRRYNPDGSRDTSFGNNVCGPFDVRADDKILGRVYVPGDGNHFRVQRFNSDGSIDPTFVNNRLDFYSVADIAPAPNNEMVVAGSYYGDRSSFAASLYRSDGLLTKFTREFLGLLSNHVYDVATQSDGKILVAGQAYFSLGTDFTVIRYLTVSPSASKPSDFDGDSKSDFAVYRAGATPTAPSYWHVLRSSDNTYQGVQFGAGGDKIVPADYDADGKTDFAVFRPSTGTWYTSLNPALNYGALQFGQNGDIPVPGDFDGDGKADHAVYRPGNGYWYILRSSNNSFFFQHLGGSGDPVLGDFDGDGKTDLAVVSITASELYWHIFKSSNATEVIQQFGITGDKPVPADYDGDGVTNIAVYRPSTNRWYTSTDPAINYGEQLWGTSGDIPAPGDFDADGHADLTVFRPGTATWYALRSGTGATGQQWGLSTDLPVTAAYIP
jgi:uncharacterized delta-60 repeat protein